MSPAYVIILEYVNNMRAKLVWKARRRNEMEPGRPNHKIINNDK